MGHVAHWAEHAPGSWAIDDGKQNTAYYPSNIDLQSSLTLANSCSSEFTLRTMAIVSLLIPFVLAYIVFAWRAIDRKRITQEEIEQGEAY